MSFLLHWKRKTFHVKDVASEPIKSDESERRFFPSADHDVSSADKLQSGLHDEDVCDVDEVAGVVGQQPQVEVLCCLVGERPTDRDQPHIPVPRRHHEEQPDHVDQICGGRKRNMCDKKQEMICEGYLEAAGTP